MNKTEDSLNSERYIDVLEMIQELDLYYKTRRKEILLNSNWTEFEFEERTNFEKENLENFNQELLIWIKQNPGANTEIFFKKYNIDVNDYRAAFLRGISVEYYKKIRVNIINGDLPSLDKIIN